MGRPRGRISTGRYTDGRGYIRVLAPGHSGAMADGYMYEHRLVAAEQMLGRPLLATEVVHHRNGVRADNRPENLEVTDAARHTQSHRVKERTGKWSKTRDECSECGGTDSPPKTHDVCVRCYDREYMARRRRTVEQRIPIGELRAAWGFWREAKVLIDACRSCGTSERRHLAKGLCSPCYQRAH